MSDMSKEMAELRQRLEDAEETLRAITSGEVDALVVNTRLGEQVFTLQGADTIYRIAIENINEGAITLSPEGTILYSNQCFARMIGTDLNRVIGASIFSFISPENHDLLAALLAQNSGRIEVSFRAADGTSVPAYVSTKRLQLDNPFICAVITDLTQQKRSEELIRTGRLIQSILEQSPNAVMVCDAAGTIIHASEAAHRLSGHNVLGEAVDNVLANIRIEGRALRFADFLGSNNKTGTTVCTRENGDILHLLLSCGRLGEDGKIHGYVITLTDVSPLRKSEEALRVAKEQLDAAFLNSPVIAFGQDTELRYTWLYNPNRSLASQPYVGKTDEDILGAQAKSLVEAKRRVIETGKGTRTVFELSGGGTQYYYDTSIEPVRDESGQVTGIVCTAIDITERKKAEEELKRSNTEMEAANKEMEAFSYSVSHDLRAPLRTLDSFSQIVIEDYGNRLDETGHDYLRRIRDASQTMSRLIDDMLKLSRISRTEMQYDRINLSGIARSILDGLRASQPERKAEFVIVPDSFVYGDQSLLDIALRNLLENAWKFTGKRQEARIEFGVTSKDRERVYFVQDNGAGFDMQYANKLFQPFQRLHSGKEYEGTGIGLAITQRVIRRHGGNIWAESEKGKGTTFFFTLGYR